jgi:hypothetical protein
LVQWVKGVEPQRGEFVPPTNNTERVATRWEKALDYVYPQDGAVRALKTDQKVYPRALTEQWLTREDIGTDAITHERILIAAGWLLYIALLIRTLLA